MNFFQQYTELVGENSNNYFENNNKRQILVFLLKIKRDIILRIVIALHGISVAQQYVMVKTIVSIVKKIISSTEIKCRVDTRKTTSIGP